jgi:hypothetical protein
MRTPGQRSMRPAGASRSAPRTVDPGAVATPYGGTRRPLRLRRVRSSLRGAFARPSLATSRWCDTPKRTRRSPARSTATGVQDSSPCPIALDAEPGIGRCPNTVRSARPRRTARGDFGRARAGRGRTLPARSATHGMARSIAYRERLWRSQRYGFAPDAENLALMTSYGSIHGRSEVTCSQRRIGPGVVLVTHGGRAIDEPSADPSHKPKDCDEASLRAHAGCRRCGRHHEATSFSTVRRCSTQFHVNTSRIIGTLRSHR